MNNSWEDPPYHNSDAYQLLCKNSTPSDFYFAVKVGSTGETFVLIVPVFYFKEHRCIWDQSINLDHLLPEDLWESMESVWETERSLEKIEKEMLERGFQEDLEFNRHCNEEFDL